MPRRSTLRSSAQRRAPFALGLLLPMALWAHSASAQRPLLDVLTPTSNAATSQLAEEEIQDPLLAIEMRLAAARQRREAIRRATPDPGPGAPAMPSASLEWSGRLVRVLEQRREAQIRSNELAAGRDAIEAGLGRDPSELFGAPPPFPVPILDGVLQAWRNAVDQENQHAGVLEDHRANHRLADEVVEDLEKQRRRLRESLPKDDDALARIGIEANLRRLDDELAVAAEQLALADQRVVNTTVEYEIKQIATRQARAARSWVEAQLVPRESDLADAIEGLDRERFDLDRQIDLARTRLVNAEGSLRSLEEQRTHLSREDATRIERFEEELATRRRLLAHRQHIVAVLNQRIERLGRNRTAWQHRYAVLGDKVGADEAPDWLASAGQDLERLTRNRRIEEAELASLRLELATLLRELTDADSGSGTARWRELELEDLEALVALYQSDLASLDRSIQLAERLRAELVARLENRDLGERMESFAETLRRFWSFEITTSEDSPITPGKILSALFVFASGYMLARFLMTWLGRRVFPRLGFDAGASNAFASLSFYALLAVTFLLALRAVNIPLTAFAVAGGAIALGLGFGSQAIVSNFISGLLLLAERPIRMGDLIEVGGVVGSVESIGLRSTRIRTADNFHIIVPNASFLESNVINWTHQDPKIRMRIAVGVAYGSATREVEGLLIQAATEHPRTLKAPAPAAHFRDFADSALAFELRFWIRYDAQTDRSQIRSEIRFRIDELFSEHGIVIAFPQLDVHLGGGGGANRTSLPGPSPAGPE